MKKCRNFISYLSDVYSAVIGRKTFLLVSWCLRVSCQDWALLKGWNALSLAVSWLWSVDSLGYFTTCFQLHMSCSVEWLNNRMSVVFREAVMAYFKVQSTICFSKWGKPQNTSMKIPDSGPGLKLETSRVRTMRALWLWVFLAGKERISY